jgi:hypothetical protein
MRATYPAHITILDLGRTHLNNIKKRGQIMKLVINP